ncbi:RNA polymerase sigma factor [Amycolatopsis sp. NPDC051716]|uniref:RNA polymerase sigma factor n=1 Tax=Amycolatopsis sp. NPDC051716 TaxID=3155804 RepID=UPI00342A7566
MTDAELIAGDAETFGVLFDRHARPLHRYCAARVGPEVAEDLVSETFCLAFRQRDRYDPSHSGALPWLYGIATNLVRRRRRQESTRYRTMARAGGTGVSSDDPAQRAINRIHAVGYARLLNKALAEMPRKQRDVLLLYALADLGYEEIATALSVPVGTVRSTLHRARKRLQAALPDHARPQAPGETIR